MGRDKAMLPLDGAALVQRVADRVARAAGCVTLIGDPAKYGHLGHPVSPDLLPDCGPLGGICTALSITASDWNLVLACDMPDIDAQFLQSLLETAERLTVDCLLPTGESGLPEPLCAVYHRRALPHIRRALESGVRKVVDGLAGLRVELLPVPGSAQFRNINTPQEWIAYRDAQMDKTHGRPE